MARHLQEQRNNTISELSTRIFVWLHGNVLELQWAIARSRMLTHRLRNTEFSIRLPLRVFSTVIIPVAERSSFSSFSHDEIFICKKNIFGFIIGMQNSRLYSIISWHWKTMYSTIGSGEILVTFYQPQIVDYSARAGAGAGAAIVTSWSRGKMERLHNTGSAKIINKCKNKCILVIGNRKVLIWFAAYFKQD